MYDHDRPWRETYKSLADYYKNAFDPQYFEFDKYELEVDPDETVEQMSGYDPARQRIEITKCALSFTYFATKYAKILHPKRGLIPFVAYKYQRGVVRDYDIHRFIIIRKFRQGGLTTLTELWGMWRCLFKLDQQILFLSKTDSEAIAAGEVVNTAMKNLPDWMRPNDGKWNDHQKHFPETGSKIVFGTPERARGLAITYLILDEAAFIPDMDRYWKAMYPTVSTGGNCIVISTVNGLGNWYADMFHAAKDRRNDFHIIDLHYTSHPEYHDDKWVRDQKAQLGEKGWQQEVLGSFLGSGETYIPMHIIGDLLESTRNSTPTRKSFKKWANTKGTNDNVDDWDRDGALWLWKEPQEGHEYIFGVDCAEGVGDDGDNSCIEVFDQASLEQVAEFYSNTTAPYIFAQIVNELAIYYNHAMVVVENMGPGGAVLSNLQHDLYYDNLFYEAPQGKGAKAAKPGLKTTPTNRPVFLESMQHRLMSGTLRINSTRLVHELTTFLYNPTTRRAEPSPKGKHDDAIMALCFALYVRDSVMRDIPMGAEVTKEMTGPFKTSIYEDIKREILDGAPKDFLADKSKDDLLEVDDSMLTGVVLDVQRPRNQLLREFGWGLLPFAIGLTEICCNLVGKT